jgi:hypothetical protein
MNVLQRVNVVGQNAARLQKIDELAKRTNVKLAPPLPPGATADAVERRLTALTKGLPPQALSHVNAVQQDLIRRGEYDRLVKAGSDAGINIKQIGTQTGRELGVPLPAFLSVPLTVFNSVAKRLMLRLDDKLAMEIAREMTDPALAAKAVQQSMNLQAQRQAGAAAGAATRQALTRGAVIGSANMLAPESESVNALAP